MKTSLHEKIRYMLNSGYNAEMAVYKLLSHQLMDKAINEERSGVDETSSCGNSPLIVSLTTYGKRLRDVATTVESIMQGSLKPSAILLHISDELHDMPLPIVLQRQQQRGLQVVYCHDIGPFTKLVPALRSFPDATIITIDDDALYAPDLVENLVALHRQYPTDIIANRVHLITLDAKGRPKKYRQWQRNANPEEPSPRVFLTGFGGVLYPPHCLPPETLDEAVFTRLCPRADDVWFYAMALLHGTPIRKGFTHSPIGEDLIINRNVQLTALRRLNNHSSQVNNDTQLEAVLTHFNLYDKLKAK